MTSSLLLTAPALVITLSSNEYSEYKKKDNVTCCAEINDASLSKDTCNTLDDWREFLPPEMIRRDAEDLQLALDVTAGNPGAMTIARELLQLPTGPSFLRYLRTTGLIGCALWRTVKDDYLGDLARFVQDQKQQRTHTCLSRLESVLSRLDH